MTAQSTPRLNVSSAVNHFGSRRNLCRLAQVHKIEPRPEYEAVKKWVQRGSIPSEHLAGMVALGRAIDKPFRLDDHVTTTTENTTNA